MALQYLKFIVILFHDDVLCDYSEIKKLSQCFLVLSQLLW